MKLILLEKITNLGNIGDQVNVKSGFGRNYLIPSGKAVFATAKNLAAFEVRRAELEKAAAETLAAAEKRRAAVSGLTVKIESQAGEEGRLFGSIGTRDIAEAATKMGVALAKSEIRMPSGPIRTIGLHEVSVQLHADIVEVLKVEVVIAE